MTALPMCYPLPAAPPRADPIFAAMHAAQEVVMCAAMATEAAGDRRRARLREASDELHRAQAAMVAAMEREGMV